MDTWLDVRDLEPGAEWDQAVSSAIEHAAGFVFLIGPPSSGDRWQTFEWQHVVDSEYFLDATKLLIPVLIGDPDVPGFLKPRKSLILGDSGSHGDVADKIVDALKDPSISVDQDKVRLGRQAQRQALESFRKYSRALEEEDIKRAGIRAME